jgi:hypothetical protein
LGTIHDGYVSKIETGFCYYKDMKQNDNRQKAAAFYINLSLVQIYTNLALLIYNRKNKANFGQFKI